MKKILEPGTSDFKGEAMKIEQIIWLDSRSEDAWTIDIDMKTCEIQSVGYVVKETKDLLCIVGSVDNLTGQYAGILYIPKVCITSRRIL